MDALWNLLENAAILVAGLAVRFAVALALLGALVALLLPFLYAGEGLRRLWMRLAGFDTVDGLAWRRHLYYSPAHAWLRDRAGMVRVGLDDLAGRLLRRVDTVLLPAAGAYLKQGEALLTMGTGRRAIVIPSPVEGTVMRVNSRLAESPAAVVDDPYGRGWLVEMQPASQEFRDFRHDDAARRWMHAEAARLSLALEHATGIQAADGGEFAIPSHLLVSDEQRMELERQFLQAVAAVRTRGGDDN